MQILQVFWQQIAQLVGGYVPNLVGALAILLFGWLLALLISAGGEAQTPTEASAESEHIIGNRKQSQSPDAGYTFGRATKTARPSEHYVALPNTSSEHALGGIAGSGDKCALRPSGRV
jgi:hypothetical protein